MQQVRILEQQDGQDVQTSHNDDVELLEWEDDADYVTVRPSGFRLLRAVLAVAILGAIGFFVYGIVSAWFASQLDPEGEPGASVEVIVPAGAATAQVANILESEGVIPNSTFFRYYVEWNNEEGFQAGDYTLQENMSADEAIDRLREGPQVPVEGEFRATEGRWLSEMIPEIASQLPSVTEQELWDVLESGALETRYSSNNVDFSAIEVESIPESQLRWEGLLFPDTYRIEEDAEPIEILAKMNDEFARVTGEIGYGAAERTHNLSAYEVIIIASLIEAEARTPEDRPKISRVIHNRLQQDIPIGIDATYIYGGHDRELELVRSVLDEPGPYNSRLELGLPPTPIAAPGADSLKAAMEPADGDWLFYVLIDDDGSHAFAVTDEEHEANKAEAREKGLLDQ